MQQLDELEFPRSVSEPRWATSTGPPLRSPEPRAGDDRIARLIVVRGVVLVAPMPTRPEAEGEIGEIVEEAIENGYAGAQAVGGEEKGSAVVINIICDGLRHAVPADADDDEPSTGRQPESAPSEFGRLQPRPRSVTADGGCRHVETHIPRVRIERWHVIDLLVAGPDQTLPCEG